MNASLDYLENKKRAALRRWTDAEKDKDKYRKLLTDAQVRTMRAQLDYEDAVREIAQASYRR